MDRRREREKKKSTFGDPVPIREAAGIYDFLTGDEGYVYKFRYLILLASLSQIRSYSISLYLALLPLFFFKKGFDTFSQPFYSLFIHIKLDLYYIIVFFLFRVGPLLLFEDEQQQQQLLSNVFVVRARPEGKKKNRIFFFSKIQN